MQVGGGMKQGQMRDAPPLDGGPFKSGLKMLQGPDPDQAHSMVLPPPPAPFEVLKQLLGGGLYGT